MLLWQRYVLYENESMGITTELTIDELKEFAKLSAKSTGDCYEVIFFSETFECPHKAEYYGIDVAGFGGYSMIGENFFTNSKKSLYDAINKYFRAKLNSNGLFNILEDAFGFRTVLNILTILSSGSVELEDWRIIHIFKIT